MPDTTAHFRKERRRAHRLLRRCINFLKEEDELIIWLIPLHGNISTCRKHEVETDCIGFYSEDETMLVIDPRHDAVATLVHELLHAVYPPKGTEITREEHRKIYRLEKLIMKHITGKQAETLWGYASMRMMRWTPFL